MLDEAWRVFSNREEGYRQGQRRLVAVVRGDGEWRGRRNQPRLGLEKDQCAMCKGFGHWKKECPRNKKEGRRIPANVRIANVIED